MNKRDITKEIEMIGNQILVYASVEELSEKELQIKVVRIGITSDLVLQITFCAWATTCSIGEVI